MTIEEYLELEERASVRHEYVGGELVAQAGASRRHNIIATNLNNHLSAAIESGACQVFQSDMKLRIADDAMYYPDVMVVCDPTDTDERFVERPCLVIEVLSPATATTDKREKLLSYRRIPTLEAYLIVSQDARHVVRHWRDSKGAWWREELVGEGSMLLSCPHTELQFGQIYKGIDFTDA
jgi:Uma2 family endonuclease